MVNNVPVANSGAPRASVDANTIIQVVTIAERIGLLDLLRNLLGSLFQRKPQLPDPPVVAPAPPVPGTPAPVPIAPARSFVVALIRTRMYAEKPDLSTPERRHDPGNMWLDAMGMAARNEAFNYGTSFWFDHTLYDRNGDPIENHELVEGNLEFRGEHRIYRKGGELVAYIKGAGDDNPAGEGQPAPYHAWSIDGIRVADSSWRKSAGLNARFRIDLEGEWEEVFVHESGVESPRFSFRTS